MQWQDDYSVGVSAMDEQHQVLVQMVGDLNDAMREGKSKRVLGDIFNRLVSYTAEHFKVEESLMGEHGYPELEAHQRKHAGMVDHVAKLQAQFAQGQLTIGLKVMNFLQDWLTKHIMQTDKDYGKYLNSKGVI